MKRRANACGIGFDHYLVGEDVLGQLRADAPELWETVTKRKAARSRLLPSECEFAEAGERERFADVLDREERELAQISGLRPDTAGHLAWGTTAEWLLACPLDFPEQS